MSILNKKTDKLTGCSSRRGEVTVYSVFKKLNDSIARLKIEKSSFFELEPAESCPSNGAIKLIRKTVGV